MMQTRCLRCAPLLPSTLPINYFKRYLYNTKIPNGRWNIENEYNGSMSNIAIKNNEYNNHDHCGGELCKYPPQPKTKFIY